MANYLDEAGLMYFWDKLKGYIHKITDALETNLNNVIADVKVLKGCMYGRKNPPTELKDANGVYYNVLELIKLLYGENLPISNEMNIGIIDKHETAIRFNASNITRNQTNIKALTSSLNALKSESKLEVKVEDHTLMFYDGRKKQ